MTDKDHALQRLSRALKNCEASGDFDQEELDHLNGVFSIISERVPTHYFDGFENFRPVRPPPTSKE
ncbi:hypothetical protein D1227_06205 [Henriciella mobilis]|uniref:hypothetical protein n=1 Tax=Henriciella mobilis TaxID=2305467 RepID=UPI000E676620|nr:hypothetical protein [Henriciella mobilis]RIJ15996.1 hypothetical protein D1231_09395 [Henriciella mobilis]RIJ21206.1 hypothetical protein D1227_12935 [Henriciella mobilis]RIJ23093.1 hypothetical protein D1227_06205 [Henriciella mobilis]